MNKLGRLRVSTAIGYLAPARARPNLRIAADTLVRRLLVENGRCVGVEAESASGEVLRHTADLVVLCAGALQSPMILMRSGYGPREQLQAHGIDVMADLPAIGGNLSDHPALSVVCDVREPGLVDFDAPIIQTILRYTAPGSDKRNDLQIEQLSFAGRPDGPARFAIAAVLEYQHGRGRVSLTGADAKAAPQIENRFCEDPRDAERLASCFLDTLAIARQPPLAELISQVRFPRDAEALTRDDVLGLCRRFAGSGYHPCGTMKMGAAEDAKRGCEPPWCAACIGWRRYCRRFHHAQRAAGEHEPDLHYDRRDDRRVAAYRTRVLRPVRFDRQRRSLWNLRFETPLIVDGSGGEPFRGDVGIDGGRIAAVGSVGAASAEIDAAGATLSPGFIDVHSHDDGAFLRHPGMEFKLSQGVTSVVAGNCGFSAVPADPEVDSAAASGGILAGLRGDFTDLAGYFDAVLDAGPAINNMMLVGHNTIRTLVMGMDKRLPDAQQLSQMQDHIKRALDQGACGFSTGLVYRPGRYSDTDEVIALAQQAQPYDALYTTHMRNEGDHLLEAVDETLRIGQESGVHVHISHHKSAGEANWGKVGRSLAKVDAALAAGQRVTLDVYPYTAGSGRMIEYFNLDNPSEDLARVIRIASCPAFREYEGRMLKDIAAEQGMDLPAAVRHVLTAPQGDRTICIQFIIDEDDVRTNLAHADMMVGSDGIPDLRGRPHPRLFGTFPKVLARYVRDEGLLSLPEAVRRMTSLPAQVFGMLERGRVAAGHWADLVLFDPDTIADTATYDDPKQEPAGIRCVLVNGRVALDAGRHTGVGAGKMLRYRQTAHGEPDVGAGT